MLNFIKYITYALKAKKGIQNTDEFMFDLSFGPIESFFIISFVILGIFTLGLGFIAFYYTSNLALFFTIIFLLILSVDVWIFIKVRRFFITIGKKITYYSKQKYNKLTSDTIVDIEYE